MQYFVTYFVLDKNNNFICNIILTESFKMKTNYIFSSFYLVAVMLLSAQIVFAQDVHNIQFNAMPMAVNPAFTGMFDGSIRVSSIYQNEFGNNEGLTGITTGVSADFPVYQNQYGDYLAAGIQLTQNGAGDGELSNTSGLFSLAYHHFFRLANFIKRHKGCDLAIGLQGSFGNRQFDPVNFFFTDNNNHYYYYPVGYYYPYSSYIGNSLGYFMVNSGVSFTQSTGEQFNYTNGVSGININQPSDPVKEATYADIGLNRALTASFYCTWAINQRFTLKPSIYYLSRGSLKGVIGGSEVQYKIVMNPEHRYGSTSLFLGGYDRTGKIVSITAGVETHAFRFGIGYDYDFSGNNEQAHNAGGIDISLRYVAPSHLFLSRSRAIPSGHF